MPCPKTFSLPEWLLEIASDERMSKKLLLKTTEFEEKGDTEQDSSSSETNETLFVVDNQSSHDFYEKSERSFVTELSVLCWREFSEVKRNISRFITDSVTAILVGILIGLLYLDVQKNLRGFQNRMGSIFFVLFFSLFRAYRVAMPFSRRETSSCERKERGTTEPKRTIFQR